MGDILNDMKYQRIEGALVPETQFNYCIGFYWSKDSDHIGTYTYFGEVHYGTMQDAEDMLAYVRGKGGEHDYQIFKAVPLM